MSSNVGAATAAVKGGGGAKGVNMTTCKTCGSSYNACLPAGCTSCKLKAVKKA